MKIVRPYAKILAIGSQPYLTHGQGEVLCQTAFRHIEWCGRISHRSEEEQKENGAENFLRRVVLEHGDWSIVEHVSVSVDMLVDRGVTHELVRHRLASYTQESTRFVNYAKKKDGSVVHPSSFIYPKPDVECKRCLDGQAPQFDSANLSWRHYAPDLVWEPCVYEPEWLYSINGAEAAYKDLLAKGWKPQEARSVFPNALASRIIMTTNLRTWRHVFLMRTSKEAHPQMRQVMIPLLAEFKKNFPVLFEDIEPEARQIDNIKKGG